MWDLVSQVVTPTLGGGCIFTEDSIGFFRSGTIKDFVGERGVSEISEGYRKEDPSCDYFMGLSEMFGVRVVIRILSGIWRMP